MAGLAAANRLYTSTDSKDMFELCVMEGGPRIGGRINTSEFGGDRIEMGASTELEVAQFTKLLRKSIRLSLSSHGSAWMVSWTSQRPLLKAASSLVHPLCSRYHSLQEPDGLCPGEADGSNGGGPGKLSVGSFLRHILNAHWDSVKEQEQIEGCDNWSTKLLEEAIFAMHENVQRTCTSAGDLMNLDFGAESEYRMFPGEEITIAKGYLSVIESLASVLPHGLIQLGRKVTGIQWQREAHRSTENGCADRTVKIHFCDGSIMLADHVLLTVSLGVLKAGIGSDSGMFNPPLPTFKTEAISRLGFGAVNKMFLQLSSSHDGRVEDCSKFPFLQMAFHRPDSELRQKKIPWWMRRTASLSPIYKNSSVMLSWFAGKEALELETLSDEEIIDGVSKTISSFLSQPHKQSSSNSHEQCSGKVSSLGNGDENGVKFTKVLRTKWGNDPLFLGSYSYVAVGSSGDDLDILAEPLPRIGTVESATSPPLQILFAGEATHTTHYSTTHGAYFSGLREASRLLQHYRWAGA
ncbi:hypothetical protein DKX38_030198 [Salix brachista]|uniref:Amine oxidase domain-containing protein n=1 Tax=Salix brachista TaxID=2182728 RepID=A0A5N5IZS8_9ROSI|nr:hypothetical protein DKX38_030198 [Salix brachista]